ncbi:MAG: hypothetical protein MUR51_04340 [Pseudomonadota bacterium]|nr:hypothetical protein [Pseudomonadota bacterium]
MKHLLTLSSLAVVLALSSWQALAADQDRDQIQLQDKSQDQYKDRERGRVGDQSQLNDQDKIYGSQLMTNQERAEYHAKMQSAKTKQERELIRNKHHELMKIRAKAQGRTLPDQAPAKGAGIMKGQGGDKRSGGGR